MLDTETNIAELEPRNGKRAKTDAVISRLRQLIVRGLKPSDRLATFNEMEQTFGVSRAVLREAVAQLKRDGFIHAVDRQGLFVAERPPYLSRFGLVFGYNPAAREWSRFSTALQQEAAGVQHARGDITFSSYYDVAAGQRSANLNRLLDDVSAHRLAGLILMPGAHPLAQTGPLASMDVPRIYVFGATEVGRMPSVGTDEERLCQRMAQWLHEKNRRRIAVVAMWGNVDRQLGFLRQHQIPYRPHWVQTVARDNIPAVRKLVTLLMDYPADQRPDGLIILDDNLTEHAVGGLLDGNVKIGQDIDVIAHCNWPWPVASAAPIQRVGYHARHVLSLALRGIELMRQGVKLGAEMASVPALFESEINQSFEPSGFDPQ